ncbi:hypothetical protein ACIQF6_35590 [Kitasatospora sp. NPDC092948]|uniref:hypothetical protein n=1 Tax=Kitasatospora sp. NPDC092948 TaxID=3364088 RepID=UPI00382412E6
MSEDQVPAEKQGVPPGGAAPGVQLSAEPESPLLTWGARRLAVIAVVGLAGLVASALGLRGGSHGIPLHVSPSLPWSTAQAGQLPAGPLKTVAPVDGRTVLTAPARFGWLPDTVRSVEYRSSPEGVTVRAQTDSGTDSAMFQLTVFPAGATPEQPTFPSGRPAVRRDAPQVNGQAAYWVSSDGTGRQAAVDTLRFRTADGRWAEVTATGLKDTDRQQLPLLVAAGVVPDAYRVPLPVSMSSLPPGTELGEARILRPASGGSGSGQWSATLFFRNKSYGSAMIEVGPGEYASAGSAPRSSNDGLATVTTSQKCASGNGLHWCVRLYQVSIGSQSAGSAAADPADWLPLVVPLGRDESGWTTDVLPQS